MWNDDDGLRYWRSEGSLSEGTEKTWLWKWLWPPTAILAAIDVRRTLQVSEGSPLGVLTGLQCKGTLRIPEGSPLGVDGEGLGMVTEGRGYSLDGC